MLSSYVPCSPSAIATLLMVALLLPVDPITAEVFNHDDQHCVDVSVWGDVQYKEDECVKCELELEKNCVTVNRQVCDTVPSTSCRLKLFTQCEMYMESTFVNETVVVTDGVYVPWQCRNSTREEIHVKLVPKCVDVVRQDCVTNWRLTPTGQKVWAGNEECKPVTWQNCTLQEEPKPFNQTYTVCERTGPPIPTMKCEMRERERTITGMRCNVDHAIDCTYTTREVCESISFQECRQQPSPLSCRRTPMRIPFQPKIHRVKCLLEDNFDQPRINPEISDRLAERKLRSRG